MYTEDYTDWEVIPEEKIEQAIEMYKTLGDPSGQEDISNFESVLAAGEMFKDAGMTPVYVFCDATCRIAVYARETYGKLLH
jgi:hypothetical protein